LREEYLGNEHKLRAQSVNTIFRNKFYMGILTSAKHPEEVRGKHVPMITERQFYKVQAILDGRNLNSVVLAKRTFDNPEFPLRRIIKCSLCGKGMTGAWSKGRSSKYAYYRCSSSCPGVSVNAFEIDKAIISMLKEITPTDKCLELFITFLERTFNERSLMIQGISNDINIEVEKLKKFTSCFGRKKFKWCVF
jgi:hypothetical protein